MIKQILKEWFKKYKCIHVLENFIIHSSHDIYFGTLFGIFNECVEYTNLGNLRNRKLYYCDPKFFKKLSKIMKLWHDEMRINIDECCIG